MTITAERQAALEQLADNLIAERAAAGQAERDREVADAERAKAGELAAERLRKSKAALRGALAESSRAFNTWVEAHRAVMECLRDHNAAGGTVSPDLLNMKVSNSLSAALFSMTNNKRFGRITLAPVDHNPTAAWENLTGKDKTPCPPHPKFT